MFGFVKKFIVKTVLSETVKKLSPMSLTMLLAGVVILVGWFGKELFLETEALTNFNMIWGALSSMLIMPVVQFIKSKVPVDWPIGADLLSTLLAFGVVFALDYGLKTGFGTEQIILYALAVNKGSQLIHSGSKTLRKKRGMG